MLSDQYVLLRDDPRHLPLGYRDLAQSTNYGRGMFKDIEIAGGGIGTGMARLWKGEVGGYVIKGGVQQPWDILPVWGISEKLGFVWLAHDEKKKGWGIRKLKPSMAAVRFERPSLIIHKSRLGGFERLNQPAGVK